MVQSKDLGAGTCLTAQDMCTNSTEAGFTDWRLPTNDELMILYNNRKSIGGFLMRPYWAYDKTYNDYGYFITYSYIDFKNGSTGTTISSSSEEKEKLGMVRAVRTVNPTTPEEPEEPEKPEETKPYVIISVVNLMVQKKDLSLSSWSTADAICKGSTLADYTDWRLPTKEELMILFNNKDLIGGSWYTRYWSSSPAEEYSDCYWFIDDFHYSGELKIAKDSYSCGVRAVRTITE